MASSVTAKATLAPIITNIPTLSITSPVSAYFIAKEFFSKTSRTPITPSARFESSNETAKSENTPEAQATVEVTVKDTIEKSSFPAIQATTNKDVGTAAPKVTSVSFKHIDDLDWRLGNEDSKAVIARFDPDSVLKPGPRLTLQAMHDIRDRALAHDILETIYGKRLIHETERNTNKMHLWVPGSRVPMWLQRLHERRSRNPVPTANKGNNATKVSDTKSTNGNKYGNGRKTNGYKGQPPLRAPRAAQAINTEMAGVWQGFAQSAPKQYASDVEKAATAPMPAQAVTEHKVKLTWKENRAAKIVEEPTPPTERKAALPPHLRKKAEAAE